MGGRVRAKADSRKGVSLCNIAGVSVVSRCRADPVVSRKAEDRERQRQLLRRPIQQDETRASGDDEGRQPIRSGLTTQEPRKDALAAWLKRGGLKLQHLPLAVGTRHRGDIGAVQYRQPIPRLKVAARQRN